MKIKTNIEENLHKIIDFEIQDGVFKNDMLVFGRIIKKESWLFGNFHNDRLDGFGEQLLSN